MVFDTATGDLTITPTDEDHQGVYKIDVTQDNAQGDDATWEAFEITVGCTISSFAADDTLPP